MTDPGSLGRAGLAARVDALLRPVPDFPRPGVVFRDITPLLADVQVFSAVVDDLAARALAAGARSIAGVEARGFVLGAPVALRAGLPFVPVRKSGRLPLPTHQVDYALEYGTATIEIHRDAVSAGQSVAVIDDVLATGGTAAAACSLLAAAGARVATVLVLMELTGLGGRAVLPGQDVQALITT